MTTLAILGASGQLGTALTNVPWARWLETDKPIRIEPLDLPDFDVTRDADRRHLFDGAGPSIVINAAAYTNVEKAEDEPQLCRSVNVEAPAELARLCAEHGRLLVHVSTDYVFDGGKGAPYTEGDATGGLSVYGRSKADGDRAVSESGARYLIARSSWLYGEGHNFVRTILRLAAERDTLTVVSDQFGCPTLAPDLAEAIARLLQCGAEGLYHFANAGICSWHEFAAETVRLAGLTANVEPVSAATLTGYKAKRPIYSPLDCQKYIATTGHTPRPWTEALRDYLNGLLRA